MIKPQEEASHMVTFSPPRPFDELRMTEMAAIIILLASTVPMFAEAVDFHQLRQKATRRNVTCLLVFGDSTVDPGNNNLLASGAPKSNFPPYGKDFFNGRPTGRFTNGRLATDFIAEAFGFGHVAMIRGFLDPTANKADLLHGISFASAGSGYDEVTANFSHSFSVSKQLEYFRHYKIHLSRLAGEMTARQVIEDAIYIVSMGTNDFLQYYVEPTRSMQFGLQQYQNFLISRMLRFVQALHSMGARRLAVVGVPPFGCIPVVKAFLGQTKCLEQYNDVAISFNSKLKRELAALEASLGIQSAYIDIYVVISSAIQNPTKYGLKETGKGCCGTGTTEVGDGCKGMNTCSDATKYVFWDAIHPTEKMYQIIAYQALKSIYENLLN
ncbi:GDSL esterase/lipase At5g45950-like [Diospyros lotus]|uniref:GDSL esterase/lipase At5g45950-like n=1 Tax=Diospyros lotus TaxID=55363 RepID=UPI00224CA749|nr:GDSL esterase/lipase At5g45950-like [Diospyros lotus]